MVLDEELHIQVWNRQMEDLWGLRENEVLRQNLLDLDLQLPVDQLTRTIRNCLAGEEPLQNTLLKAINRRGREFDCLIFCKSLKDARARSKGVVIEMRDNSEIGRIQVR